MNQKLNWIFFDVGGVLGDETQFLTIREKYVLASIQLFEPGVTTADVKERWAKASTIIGDIDKNVLCEFLRDSTQQRIAIEHMLRLRNASPKYYEVLKIRANAKEVLSALAPRFRLGLMANQGKEVRHFLRRSDCFDYFHYTNVSGDLSLSKPDPLFFQTVLGQAEADPQHSILIDDNIERGLIPAKKLGMRTIWYRLQQRAIPTGVIDNTIDSLGDLLEIL